MKLIACFILLPLLISACGSAAVLKEKTSLPMQPNSIKSEPIIESDIVRFLSKDPKIQQLKLAVENGALNRKLIEQSMRPQVNANSSIGGANDGSNAELAGTLQFNLTKDADLTGAVEQRNNIVDYETEISRLSILAQANERLYAILSNLISADAANEKIGIIDEGMQEYEKVAGLIEAAHSVGALPKGKYLEIKNQVSDVEIMKSQIELTRDLALAKLEIELSGANSKVKKILDKNKQTVAKLKVANGLDGSVNKINKLRSAILEENLKLETNSSKWNGSYASSITSSVQGDPSVFAGVQLIKPVYDAGQSHTRMQIIKNQLVQTSLDLASLERDVKTAFLSLEKTKRNMNEGLQLLSNKIDNLYSAQTDLERRRAAGKAQLEELAGNIIAIANTRLKQSEVNFEFKKAKLDYLILNQSLYSAVLSKNEIRQLMN